MANVAHASLSGSELHEPKGVDAAQLGTVYVANGAGSGTWNDVGTASFTGMIADFVAPVPPAGWLECNGSTISTSTFAGLTAVMTIASSGTRTNSQTVITSIPSTATFRVGYFVFGTGLNGVIVSIDSATQITINNGAASSGSANFLVSPWEMGNGTIKLPDTSAGRYRRARTSATKVGDLQADQNQAHTHTATPALTASTDPGHVHGNFITDFSHSHSHNASINQGGGVGVTGGGSFFLNGPGNATINASGAGIALTNAGAGAHTHSITGTVTNTSVGGTEARPLSLVVLTCVKT